MKFKSKKSFFVGIIFGIVCLLMLFIAIKVLFYNRDKWIALVSVLPLFSFILSWFNTYYVMQDEILSYKSGFVNGAINIVDIREIIVGKTWFVSWKPALASKGLIVKYNRWDEIYISPEKETLFLEELLKINPEIKINKA